MGKVIGIKNSSANLEDLGIKNTLSQYWNLTQEELVEETIKRNQGQLNDTGALAVCTGEFTGRSPKDKFFVKDSYTENVLDWGDINIPISAEVFEKLYNKIANYFEGKEVFVRDCYACAKDEYRTNVRVVSELPWATMFAGNMFLRPTQAEIESSQTDWLILHAPGFKANGAEDGIRQHNFSIINLSKKIAIIGGSAYTGEIKKGIFSVLNMVLPHEHKVLSMHCSANAGEQGDVALFFGLSGTGKTTLSADPERPLIGDDEHGWDSNSVFNFEGGCYAKCIDLSAEKEPDIYGAIKHGAILENIGFIPGTRSVDYAATPYTENTRVSYPLHFIKNALPKSVGGEPKNIFFLTYDAFGVLPPISQLTVGQAMYYFLSGFTSKVAGTEVGVVEPQTTFSACFGAVFLPLHPTKYAELLGEKLEKNPDIKVWLLNTGYTGGAYGTGKRMSLTHTRALIKSALSGNLNNVTYETHPVFGLKFPTACDAVPAQVLNPRNTWENKDAYDTKALDLAKAFAKNFKKFEGKASEEMKAAAPKVPTEA
ncbi:MAG: phosphoenolpyruvate carboxykinase (ATP) [Chitinophagales bacterium]|nr:phosphoenolpyruvate carboxykinase (ATP) [Chitinophagales bacterium]MCO5279585.1 phosphoenolpyruvate carboxykinase (ATP) [Chitinophagales bacterium]OJV24195.1 MAG: phosphoenolpyruvate carboxykinase (ATP) [Bacteroidetes bacterium 37-13]HRN93652.1 phosphoenolpyruvate carboxykinase (ATP) [Chitinophagales bacterium]HRP40035.1 phosphoenolpyruvate carboxykinase (ATP) [Chitinophagales bacterium]